MNHTPGSTGQHPKRATSKRVKQPRRQSDSESDAERVPMRSLVELPWEGPNPNPEYGIEFYNHRRQLRATAEAMNDGVQFELSPDTDEVRTRNARTLAAWVSERERARASRKLQRHNGCEPSADEKMKRAQGMLRWAGDRLGDLTEGERDDLTNTIVYRVLSPFYNDGLLGEAEIAETVVAGAKTSHHIPDNKSEAKVRRDVARILSDGARDNLHVDWDELDADNLLSTVTEVTVETLSSPTESDTDDEQGPDYTDIAGILADSKPVAEPDILHRADGHALFYRGELNHIYGDPEDGKTWIALAACAETLCGDGKVLYVDLDDNGGAAIVERLTLLGVPRRILVDINRFRHIQPDDKLDALAVFGDCLPWQPDVVVIDSVGELIPLFKGSSDSADHYTEIVSNTVRPLALGGACIIMIDHLAKSPDSRAYGAGGSMAKRRKLGGTSIRTKVGRRFVRGRGGTVHMMLRKDRHGGVREHIGADREPDCGTLVLDSGTDPPSWRVTAPLVTFGAVRTEESFLASARELPEGVFTIRALAQQHYGTDAPSDSQIAETHRATKKLSDEKDESRPVICVFAGRKGKGGESLWQLR